MESGRFDIILVTVRFSIEYCIVLYCNHVPSVILSSGEI